MKNLFFFTFFLFITSSYSQESNYVFNIQSLTDLLEGAQYNYNESDKIELSNSTKTIHYKNEVFKILSNRSIESGIEYSCLSIENGHYITFSFIKDNNSYIININSLNPLIKERIISINYIKK